MPDRADAPSSEQRTFLLTALALSVVTLWGLSLRGSLWIDELGTYWVVKDGLSQAIHRATNIQGQTPLYYVIEWVVRAAGGTSEFMLRLPSLLAMGLATYLLYRIARRLMAREAALISTIIFSGLSPVVFAAADARPYAVAMLFLITTTLFLVRWLDEGRRVDAAMYVLFAALTVYAHYLFALALLAHLAYAYARRDRVRLSGILFAVGGIGVLLIPALPQFLSLLRRRASLSVPNSGLSGLLFDTLAPSALAGGVLLGLLIARAIKPISVRTPSAKRGAATLAAGWLLVSPLLLYAVSTFTTTRVFADRYLLAALPGLALLMAIGLMSITDERSRVLIVLSIVVSSIFVNGFAAHSVEDWRDGVAAINALVDQPDTPVLVHSALIEARQTSWLRDPFKASYLMDPVAYYPVKGHPIPMPYFFDDSARSYLDSLLPTLRTSDHFLLITRYAFVEFAVYLEGRLEAEGFTMQVAGHFGAVTLYDYRKGTSGTG